MAVTGPNPTAQNQRGYTGGLTWIVQAAPFTPFLNYTPGLVLGGVLRLDNFFVNRTGILQSVNIVDRAAKAGAMNIYFFNSEPVGTYTDGESFTMNSTDKGNCICVLPVLGDENYITGGGVSIQSIRGIGQPMTSINVGPLWCLPVANGTYKLGEESLTLSFGVLQD